MVGLNPNIAPKPNKDKGKPPTPEAEQGIDRIKQFKNISNNVISGDDINKLLAFTNWTANGMGKVTDPDLAPQVIDSFDRSATKLFELLKQHINRADMIDKAYLKEALALVDNEDIFIENLIKRQGAFYQKSTEDQINEDGERKVQTIEILGNEGLDLMEKRIPIIERNMNVTMKTAQKNELEKELKSLKNKWEEKLNILKLKKELTPEELTPEDKLKMGNYNKFFIKADAILSRAKEIKI